MPSTPEEAKARLERAFRVKFDREPERAQEQTLILMAQDRIADGSSFRWEGTPDNPELRFGTVDEERDTAKDSDLMALEAEETTEASVLAQSFDTKPDAKGAFVKQCSQKEATFCRLVASGMTQTNAYYRAGYRASSRDSAYSCASQVMARPHVSRYLRMLRESSFLADVLSLGEKRAGLAEVWRTPVGQIDENHPLAQEVKRKIFTDKDGNKTGEEVTVKMPSKLQALELDAKLAGELKEQATVNVGFAFGMLGDNVAEGVSGEILDVSAEEVPEKGGLPE